MNLKPYQEQGVAWLAGRRYALLADEMGLGKTAQAIVAAQRAGMARVLVLCPAIAKFVWQDEWRQWAGAEPAVLFGGSGPIPGAGTVVCNYDLLHTARVREALLARQWDLLICDEAHALKNPKAKRTKYVLGRAGLVKRAGAVWMLTGTPVQNHPAELWPAFYVFGGTPLAYYDFARRYCHVRPTPWGDRIEGVRRETAGEFKDLMAKFVLRRTKDQVAVELPPLTISQVPVDPGPLVYDYVFPEYGYPTGHKDIETDLRGEVDLFRQHYELAKRRDQMHTDEGDNRLNALALLQTPLMRLRRLLGAQKVVPVADLVRPELKSGEIDKLVIFAIHRCTIEMLRAELREFKPVMLYGGTVDWRRKQNLETFATSKRCRVFLGSIPACGTAISLTNAHQIVFAEFDWVPAVNLQAAMRCHRLGQTKPVTARMVYVRDSVDDVVLRTVRNKMKVLNELSLA